MTSFQSIIIKTQDDLELNIRQYGNVRNSKKSLIITHGYGEHQGYYSEFADFFSENDFLVLTYDLRSHGLSEGRRGDVADFSFFLDDLRVIVSYAGSIKQDNEIYLFGHSLGGSIVLNFLLRFPHLKIKKAIVSSPWLKLAFDPPFYKLAMAKLGKLFFPSLVIKGELRTADLSRDNKFVEKFDIDTLTYDKISSRYYFSIRDAGLFALENASGLKTRVLISHGDDDKVTSYEASKQFCENSMADFKSWDGGYRHVVFSENDKKDIFNYYLGYLSTL
jgi:acylglycerol lipase